jgi:hypothetical protein
VAIAKPEQILKRVTGRMFTISKSFHRCKKNFILDFLCKRTVKNVKKPSVLVSKKKSLVFYDLPSKKYSSRDTLSADN